MGEVLGYRYLPYPISYYGDELLSLPNLEAFTYKYRYDFNAYSLEDNHVANIFVLCDSLRRHPKIKEINLVEHPAIPKENSRNKIKRKMILKKSSRKFLKVSESINNLKCSRKVKMVKKYC